MLSAELVGINRSLLIYNGGEGNRVMISLVWLGKGYALMLEG